MKNDLTTRADISRIIQSLNSTNFGFKKPMCNVNFKAQAAIVAFNAVSTYIGTRDLVQEYLAFKRGLWQLSGDMPEVSKGDASDAEPRLIRLQYKYSFEDEFGKPNDG
jgi:hypothetical protein